MQHALDPPALEDWRPEPPVFRFGPYDEPGPDSDSDSIARLWKTSARHGWTCVARWPHAFLRSRGWCAGEPGATRCERLSRRCVRGASRRGSRGSRSRSRQLRGADGGTRWQRGLSATVRGCAFWATREV